MHSSAVRHLGLFMCLLLTLVGCGGDSSSSSVTNTSSSAVSTSATSAGATKSLTVVQPLLPLAPAGETIDSVEIKGFDANGQKVYVSKVDVSPTMQFSPVPTTAVTLQIDYLRNHGYCLLRSTVDLRSAKSAQNAGAGAVRNTSSEVVIENPQPQAAHDTTKFFSVSDGSGGFKLMYSVNGGTAKQIVLKGLDYSPAPINTDVNNQAAIADFFWDTFPVGGGNVYNWYALWGFGQLSGNFYGRDDLNVMRNTLGANCIRVYTLIAKQLPPLVNGAYPDYSSDGAHHFTHQQFLDLCWNNGENPLFVLADLAMPDESVNNTIPQTPGEVAWWEANLSQSVTDVGDHPAIMGFDLWNEQDTSAIAAPGAPTSASDYFYSQNKKYADTVKKIAPDKMVGWALHDFPSVPYFASNFGPTTAGTSGQKYADLLSSFDFWGVNTYQTLNLDPLLSPTIQISNGLSYAELPTKYQKPVIFTEFGWSAAGHDAKGNLFWNAQTDANTAAVIKRMYGMAYGTNPYPKLLVGCFYFEYCDEWWKQGDKTAWNPSSNPDGGFPNGYNDQEAYGLYAIAPGPGKTATDPAYLNNGPTLPVNSLTARPQAIKALSDVFKGK